MEQWGGTGIIAPVETAKVTETILASGLPTVALDLSDKQLAPGSPDLREIHFLLRFIDWPTGPASCRLRTLEAEPPPGGESPPQKAKEPRVP